MDYEERELTLYLLTEEYLKYLKNPVFLPFFKLIFIIDTEAKIGLVKTLMTTINQNELELLDGTSFILKRLRNFDYEEVMSLYKILKT
jgi:hypothetical protein